MIGVWYLLRLLALRSITRLLPRAQGSAPPPSSSPSSGTEKERGYAAGESGHVCVPGFQSKIGKPLSSMPGFQPKIGKPLSICSACDLRGSFPHKTFLLYFHQVNVSSAERGASWKCKKRPFLQISVLFSCVCRSSLLHLNFLCFLLLEGDV